MTHYLDRRFRSVGRIKRSAGTEHKPTIKLLDAMLSGLFASGRLDVLRALKDKTYTPLQVYEFYRINELERLPTVATMAPLKEAWEKWQKAKECSEAHRRSLAQSLRHLLGAGRSAPAVTELAGMTISLRQKLQGKHARSFNLARAAAQAFVKSTLRQSSPLYSALKDIEPLKVVAQRTRHPATPTELAEISSRLSERDQLILWGMASTGMGPTEFWGSWEMLGDRIQIHGTKRAGRERFVPRFTTLLRPAVLYPAFRRALALVSDLKPYDLRRSYANWLEAAGIPRTRRRLYMGHGESDITDRYEWHEVEKFLREDSQRLKDYVFGGAIENKSHIHLVMA